MIDVDVSVLFILCLFNLEKIFSGEVVVVVMLVLMVNLIFKIGLVFSIGGGKLVCYVLFGLIVIGSGLVVGLLLI